MKKIKELFSVFLAMMKIGAFTFGGGYAMIALLENEFVSRRAWLDKDEFLDLAAIAESPEKHIPQIQLTEKHQRKAK